MYQSNDPRPRGTPLPTMYDLPSEDPEEPGLPDEFHSFQPQLLRETCLPPTIPSETLFIGTDLNLYYDSRHPLWHKRPDWFMVLGVLRPSQQQDLRWSYVVWDEGRSPFLVVELLSPGTEAEDLGRTLGEVQQPPTKWQVYEQVLRIPYYLVFDRYTHQLRAFRLVATRYEELPLPEGKLWFEELSLGLGLWLGEYQHTHGLWLRWYDAKHHWLPTPEERALAEGQRAEAERQKAEAERQRAEVERQKAEAERQRADRLAAQLRQLGIDPD